MLLKWNDNEETENFLLKLNAETENGIYCDYSNEARSAQTQINIESSSS